MRYSCKERTLTRFCLLQIQQMEALYESAISKLQERVGSLEHRTVSGRKFVAPGNNSGQGNNNAAEHGTLPKLPVGPTSGKVAPVGRAVPKIGRLVPASKASSNALRPS